MIHIYTLHFKGDYWVDLQLESFKKHIKVPYKSYAIFSHMDEKVYDKHKDKYDYFEVREKGKHIYKGGNYHLTDGNRHIIPVIKRNMAKNDIIIRIDSDAFFINDVDDNFIDKVRKNKFTAMHEPQHEWDLNNRTPHPAFYCFLGKYLDEGLDYNLGEMIEDENNNWWGGVESWMSINSIDWKPLSRTNKVNLHPIYFGIYGDLIYHHWAGSRKMITRPDRRRAAKTGEDIELIAEENHQISASVFEQIENQLDVFMDYLRGKYDGDLV